mmetsp:Transcript_8662/g.13325  ORF Transcript_8662/g.13325 Transcript_8662/m.13325 type:complete len:260 (-) Transcript_8662:892-1671(-)
MDHDELVLLLGGGEDAVEPLVLLLAQGPQPPVLGHRGGELGARVPVGVEGDEEGVAPVVGVVVAHVAQGLKLNVHVAREEPLGLRQGGLEELFSEFGNLHGHGCLHLTVGGQPHLVGHGEGVPRLALALPVDEEHGRGLAQLTVQAEHVLVHRVQVLVGIVLQQRPGHEHVPHLEGEVDVVHKVHRVNDLAHGVAERVFFVLLVNEGVGVCYDCEPEGFVKHSLGVEEVGLADDHGAGSVVLEGHLVHVFGCGVEVLHG